MTSRPATRLLDLTLDSPTANLALDEALLEEAESSRQPSSVLRLWEPPQNIVVLGQSCRYRDEVHVDFCNDNQIPILRRASGGGTIVTGPGCLMYALLVPYQDQEKLRMIDQAHLYVLAQLQAALNRLFQKTGVVQSNGLSDLVVGPRKFSGNAMRCKRHHFLYHGTLLCDYDLEMIPRVLKTPPRQPDYRANRSHLDFVTNLNVSVEKVKASIIEHWKPEAMSAWPRAMTEQLTSTKYSCDQWNQKR